MTSVSSLAQHQLKEQILDQVLRFLLDGDWQQIEMQNIANHCGISEPVLRSCYPTLSSITTAVNTRLTETFIQHLDLSSRENLRLSWLDSLDSSSFSNIVRLFIDASQQQSIAWRLANVGWTQFSNLVASKLGYQAVNQDLPWLLGKSMLKFINQRNRS
ncbi:MULTISPECIES: hypothetical protein [Agarivorans]|jgi:hypothetical protein|uniref:TetR/AcrR family transcriptional regulator n=1 Tax=Agarivorans gilvus TaxID=680279 RepID=A0ABQ1I750_9ALTE|nr:hypothetical protein [Agarivorans gilvus]GGB15331.1 hypothetical protein GCM10007414_30990 [Agarivorans gilvus]